ncbi:MAG TPA: tRNA-dihydrouridine synthase, partial [Ramlibacter sp.]|uniref:tRNA dihydrouridine synthase n=1 Tax=Ramlibacter sp. TaxID=1917967 RepID=UPI002D7F1D12
EAAMMAEAAVYNVERGAQIIDINMGCPAKKVCSKWAGSALMQDEPLGVPVTLKMRTGWSQTHRNAVALARAFEDCGVQMLTVHGRTREQGYQGEAEYETIAAVKAAVRVPVVANGDIVSPRKARAVLAATGADAVMIGRAAQGRPWIFREVVHFLATGAELAPPLVAEVQRALLAHLQDHYALYGESTGVRSARKHIGWYVRTLPGGEAFRTSMNEIEDSASQLAAVAAFFDALGARMDRLPPASEEETEALAESGA